MIRKPSLFHQTLALTLAGSLLFGPTFQMDRAYAGTGAATGDAGSGQPGSGQGSDGHASSESTGKNSYTNIVRGTASFSIPIPLAPGKDGMGPPIGLGYSSEGRASWVGYGWSLDAGRIERRGKSGGLPTFDDATDQFRLSMPGVSSDLTFKSGNEYYTQQQTFHRIVKDANGWTVTDPSGTIYKFGALSNSNGTVANCKSWYQSNPNDSSINPSRPTCARFLRDPNSTDPNAENTSTSVRAWALNKIQNTNGYAVDLFYRYVDGDNNNLGDYYLSRIEYTKLYDASGNVLLNTGALVEFELEPRGANNTLPSFSSGGLAEMDQRLSIIRSYVRADNPSKKSLLGLLALFYTNNDVNVDGSGNAPSDWVTSESKLTKVEQYGTGGMVSGNLQNRWVLDYSARTPEWQYLSVPGDGSKDLPQLTAYDSLNGTPSEDLAVRMADLNGDGSPDYVQAGGIDDRFAQAPSPSQTSERHIKLNFNGSYVDPATLPLNTPGKGYANFPNDFNIRAQGYRSPWIQDTGCTLDLDVNGDGLPDLWCSKESLQQLQFLKLAGGQEVSRKNVQCGGGIDPSDIDGNKRCCPAKNKVPGPGANGRLNHSTDVVIEDPITPWHEADKWRRLYLNNGNGFDAAEAYTEASWIKHMPDIAKNVETGFAAGSISYNDYNNCAEGSGGTIYIDLNGDGFQDVASCRNQLSRAVYPAGNTNGSQFTNAWVCQAKLNPRVPGVDWTDAPALLSQFPTHISASDTQLGPDMNGDGLPDIVHLYRDTNVSPPVTHADIWLNAGVNGWIRSNELSTGLEQANKVFVETSTHSLMSMNVSLAGLDLNFMDVNSDGRADLVTNCETLLNNGRNGFGSGGAHRDPLLPNGSIDPSRQCFRVDANGQTVAVPNLTKSTPMSLTRSAHSISNGQDAYQSFGTRTGYHTGNVRNLLGEYVNNNGVVLNGHASKIFTAKGNHPGLLSHISLPTGASIDFTYQSWSSAQDEPANVSSSINKNGVPFVTQAVSQVTVNAKTGVSYTTHYTYRGGKYDRVAKEFFGFQKVIVNDPQGMVSETTFHQSKELKGSVAEEKIKDSNGALFSRVKHYYLTNLADPDDVTLMPSCPNSNLDCLEPFFNPARRTESFIYDGSASYRMTRADSNVVCSHDPSCKGISDADRDPGPITLQVSKNYGEPTGANATPADKQTTSVTRFIPNTADWILGLPARSRVMLGIVDDDTSGTILTETKIVYDQRNGNGHWDSGEVWDQPVSGPTSSRVVRTDTIGYLNGDLFGPVSTSSQVSYDATYKHPIEAKDANGNSVKTFYEGDVGGQTPPDHLPNTFPTRMRQIVLVNGAPTATLESLTDYDVYGRVNFTIDPNGVYNVTHYDQFHRPDHTYVKKPWNVQFSEAAMTYNGFCDTACSGTIGVANPDNQYVKSISLFDSKSPGTTSDDQWLWSEAYQDGLGRGYFARTLGLPHNIVAKKEFDSVGRPSRGSVPYYEGENPQFWTVSTYDAMGRVSTVTAPGNIQSRIEYDKLHRTTIDPKGHRKDYFSNALGQLERVTEYVNNQAHSKNYFYDVLGNLTRVTDSDPNHPATVMTYDGFGRKREMIDPDMGLWKYEYDNVGNLKKQTDNAGNIMNMVYDSLNRLIEKHHTPIHDPSYIDLFTYDQDEYGSLYGASLGKIIRESSTQTLEDGDHTTTTEYYYDTIGRLDHKSLTIAEPSNPAGDTVTYAYGYNTGNAVSSLIYQTSGSIGSATETIYYRYDSAAKLVALERASGTGDFIRNVEYDASGRFTQIRYGDNTETAYRYNDGTNGANDHGDQRLNQLTTGIVGQANAGSLMYMEYAYDPNGNVTQILDHINNVGNKTYGYDDLDRLTSAVLTYSSNGGGVENRTYKYDLKGNLLEVAGPYFPFMKPYFEPLMPPSTGGGGGQPQTPTRIRQGQIPTVDIVR